MLSPDSRSAGMILLLLLTAITAFIAGVLYARLTDRWHANRLRTERQLTQFLKSLTASLDTAIGVCDLRTSAPLLRGASSRLDGIQSRAAQLVERLDDVQSRTTGSDTPASEQGISTSPSRPTPLREVDLQAFSAAWIREPCDPFTGLPERSAFLANLATLMTMATDTATTGGLLLVQIDRYDHLVKRFGSVGVNILTRKLANVLESAARDEDLVCRYDEETFAILQPVVDSTSAVRLAEVIRDSVRHFHFRIEESRPEVLLTCSFGHTMCEPPENGDLLLNRAANALARSRRRGRNQLHTSHGAHTLHCAR